MARFHCSPRFPNSKEFVAALAAGDAAGAQAKAKGWIYAGYKMTIFSTAEEQQREPLEIGGKVLFYPDFALRTAGGDVSVLAPWKSYVLQDRELISGQNPFSDEALLKLLLPALDGEEQPLEMVVSLCSTRSSSFESSLLTRKAAPPIVLFDGWQARSESQIDGLTTICAWLRLGRWSFGARKGNLP